MSTGASPAPLFSCLVGFASNPYDSPQVQVEMGPRLLRAQIDAGRQHHLDQFDPGGATFTFFDPDRTLDPTNTAGPYYGQIDVNKQVQFGVVVNCLSAAQAAISGGWTAGSNTSIGYASSVMTLTNSSAGSATISATTTGTGTAGFRVLPGHQYFAHLFAEAAVTARSVTWSFTWYDINGNTISTSSATFTDGTGAYSHQVQTYTTPSNAAYGSETISVASTAAGEQHLFKQTGIVDSVIQTNNLTWQAGGQVSLYTGFVEKVVPKWGTKMYTEVDLVCTDLMRVLGTLGMPADPLQQQMVTNGATSLWPFDDPSGNTTAREVISGKTLTLNSASSATFGNPARASAFGATTLTVPLSTPLPPFTVPAALCPSGTQAYTLELWYNPGSSGYAGADYIFASSPNFVANQFNLQLNAVQPYFWNGSTNINGGSFAADGKWHHLAVTHNGSGTYTLYWDGSSVASTSGSAVNLTSTSYWMFSTPDGPLQASDFAIYLGVCLTAGQVSRDYQIGANYFPSASTVSSTRIGDALAVANAPASIQSAYTHDAGNSTIVSPNISPGSALSNSSLLSYLQTVANAEYGFLFVSPSGALTFYDRHHLVNPTPGVTFGDSTSGTEVVYKTNPTAGLDNIDLYTQSTVAGAAGNIQTANNATAQTKYGVLTLNESGIPVASDSEMRDRAFYNVNQYSTTKFRVPSVSVDVLAQASLVLPLLLIGSPPPISLVAAATFTRRTYSTSTGFGSPAFSQTVMIEGISHSVDLTRGTWSMTVALSVADVTPYWVLGTSQLGTTTALGY